MARLNEVPVPTESVDARKYSFYTLVYRRLTMN